MPRPDPFSQESIYDELITVIDRHRSREAKERADEQDAQFEREHAAEKHMQSVLITHAVDTLASFMKCEERRVAALEQLAANVGRVADVLRGSMNDFHSDALNGLFKG